jgi:geranylgeranylglycerol-phosphate geranylgeranyltransferase
MLGYVQLLRPGNCLMAVLSILIVSLVAAGLDLATVPLEQAAAASLVVFAFTGAGNALNDYLDRANDAKNHPGRPLPSGSATPRGAALLSATLFAAAVALGLWLSPYCMLIILLNLAVMLGYEFKAKAMGLGGNLMISWLTASLFLFGGFAVLGEFPGIMEPVLFMFMLSFCATLGREIAKDIQDMGGDLGRRTLPMVIGKIKAGRMAAMAFLAGIALSPLPYILGIFGFIYLVAVLFANAIFIYAAAILSRDAARASAAAKLAMMLSLAAFLLGVI